MLKIQKYDQRKIQEKELDNFSSSSAYCNGNNYLFISGGVKNKNEIMKKFWKINLGNQMIELTDIISFNISKFILF